MEGYERPGAPLFAYTLLTLIFIGLVEGNFLLTQ